MIKVVLRFIVTDNGFEYVETVLFFYKEKLTDVINTTPYRQAYMNGSNHLFKQIASYEAVFNRMIIYRCTRLIIVTSARGCHPPSGLPVNRRVYRGILPRVFHRYPLRVRGLHQG